MDEKYTEKEWEDEMQLNKFCRYHPNWFHSGCFLSCPRCHTFGFYGPKIAEDNAGIVVRKYRACKFCGFWQEVCGDVYNEKGGEPYRCVAVHCDKCGAYDWRVPWAERLGKCDKCHIELKETKWASDNPDHPFHKDKEIMDKIHQKLKP